MKGVLLVNLGSPESTSTKDVKSFLDEFLMDKFVIDIPYFFRYLLVKGIILNTRPKKSSQAYKKIWWKEGSPLIVLSKKLHKKVQSNVKLNVELAMRYGNPSIERGIKKLVKLGVDEIFVIPLYPQYAMATTGSIIEKTNEISNKLFPNIKITCLYSFYNKPDYIEVLSNVVENQLNKNKVDHLLFSYHGIPERHIKKTDITKTHCKIDDSCCNQKSEAHKFCYRHQCFKTTEMVAKKLQLKEGTYSTSFQSRLGKSSWLQPYTYDKIDEIQINDIKKMAIVTPSFVSDCLETLEEICVEGKKTFIENGGEAFTVIPCLNDDNNWAKTISKWINNWEKQN